MKHPLVTRAIAATLMILTTMPLQAHDIGDTNYQYSRLNPDLAKELRERDKSRTASNVHAFEAAGNADKDEKKVQILNQFGIGSTSNFEQVYVKHTLWPTGHRFRVCFFDGDASARQHVFDLFDAIILDTNLKLDRTDRSCPDTKADIQITFKDATKCYSYMGRDALDVIKSNANLPTMGLCSIVGPLWDVRHDGVIRHEIMHSLGAAHEHQLPNSSCKDDFNLDAFRSPPFFDPDPKKNEEAIRVNIEEITQSYPAADLLIFPYDPKSVMHYKLDARFFKPGAKCALLNDNNDLSPHDWEFLKKMYPK
jgi:hypothetical protein